MDALIEFNVRLLGAIADFLGSFPMIYLVGVLIGIAILDFVVGCFFRR